MGSLDLSNQLSAQMDRWADDGRPDPRRGQLVVGDRAIITHNTCDRLLDGTQVI